jgi:hypothetical protein
MVVYQYYTLKMRKRKGGNLQISSTMVFFPLYFIMDSGYTNEVSVYKLYLLGVNLSVIGRVLGQAFLRTTSPSRLRRATSPGRGGFGSPRKVNGFARGSPTRGAVERSETERLYEDGPVPVSKARPFASCRASGVQWKVTRPAKGSPSGGAGAKRLRGRTRELSRLRPA